MAEVKKYWVKQSWIFNLESMQDKLAVMEMDIDDGELSFPLEIAGTTVHDYGELSDLKDECGELEWAAKSGKVTGRQYGRIKAIVAWRVGARYATCLANGMSEADAGQCFKDM